MNVKSPDYKDQKNQQLEIKMSGEIQKQFLLTSKIGNGNFSTVYLAKHIETQEIVAVKTMKNHIPIAIKQAQLLKKMNHPNIIKLYKFQKLKNKEQALIVLQYVPQNILQLYQAQQYGLKQDQVKCILFQSCLGLHYIHKRGIIHRDIKPQNIMINRNKAEVKLIDFGLAIEQDKCITDYVATRWYRAPENLLGTKEYTIAIDIFSLGCVIVELYLGNPLFPGANNVDQISKILTMMGEPSFQSWRKGYEKLTNLGLNFQVKPQKKKTLRGLLTSCSEGLIKLLQRMLVLNPLKRITAEEILRDQYFKDIEKIIPPAVYDQYLIDIKVNRMSMIMKEPVKAEKRKDVKERVRFLSQEKGFGAFSSFKSVIPLNKLQSDLNTSRQRQLNQNYESAKKLQMKWNQSQQSLVQKSNYSAIKKSNTPSIIQIKPVGGLNYNQSMDRSDIPSSMKSSIQNYEKNLMKLSTSLKNIKTQKGNYDVKNDRNQQLINLNSETNNILQNQTNTQKYNPKSSEMLSFRGFNQPKQKLAMKESSSSFFKKNSIHDEKSANFPIKSKKVIEYLQKFQNVTNQKQSTKQKLQNSRSQPSIYQSLNNITPKKPQLLNTSKPFFLRQSPGKQQQVKLNQSQSSIHMTPKQKNSFHHYQASPSGSLYQSYRKESQPSQTQLEHTPIMINAKDNRYETNSPSIQKSYQLQSQSPFRTFKQNTVVKFNSFSSDQYRSSDQYLSHKQLNTAQNSITSSRELNESDRNFYISPSKKTQVLYAEPISLNARTSPLHSSVALTKTTSMNVSSNRPIQNKIKLIAVRDTIPKNNPINNFRNQHASINQSCSNLNLIRNPSFSHNAYNLTDNSSNLTDKNSNFTDKNSNFVMKNFSSIDKINPVNSCSSLHSPKKQLQYLQQSLQMYPSQFQPLSNKFDSNQQNSQYFKQLQHRQFYTKKSANRYSINTSQEQFRFSQHNNYTQMNETSMKHEPKSNQKNNNQTTLSQLRESITGLTQTLNQGNFLSQRSQKLNNKNININLNLNIYDNKLPKRK